MKFFPTQKSDHLKKEYKLELLSSSIFKWSEFCFFKVFSFNFLTCYPNIQVLHIGFTMYNMIEDRLLYFNSLNILNNFFRQLKFTSLWCTGSLDTSHKILQIKYIQNHCYLGYLGNLLKILVSKIFCLSLSTSEHYDTTNV